MSIGNKNRAMALVFFSFFTIVGTYNAVVINSESSISGDIKFVKRLDEVYGVTVPGRLVAASMTWKKIRPAVEQPKVVVQEVSYAASSSSSSSSSDSGPSEAPASIQEELNLSLTEVVNTKKWANGLKNFSGSLVTNNGAIESLEANIDGESVSIPVSEMSGNVFTYKTPEGEECSGMMYQVDQNAYKVTFSNGPLEGTHLRFSSTEQSLEQQHLADAALADSNVNDNQNQDQQAQQESQPAQDIQQQEIAQQEAPAPETFVQTDEQLQQEGVQAQEQASLEQQQQQL